MSLAQASFHNESLKRYNLGFANAIAGLIWIDLLQDSSVDPIPPGKVSWEFTQVDAVTQLDPSFGRAYSFGSVFLSVFKRDKLGAKKILERWVQRRPTYWRTHYLLGYHLFYELKDYSGGAHHILAAASMENAPSWLSALGIRLMSETGALATALKVALDLYAGMKSEEGRTRLQLRVRSLNFALQKAAWNHALIKFRGQFRREPSSVNELRPFAGMQFRELAAIVAGEGVTEEIRPVLTEVFPFRYNAKKRAVECEREISDLDLDTVGVFTNEGS